MPSAEETSSLRFPDLMIPSEKLFDQAWWPSVLKAVFLPVDKRLIQRFLPCTVFLQATSPTSSSNLGFLGGRLSYPPEPSGESRDNILPATIPPIFLRRKIIHPAFHIIGCRKL